MGAPFTVPMYLTAKTADELMMVMAKNNVKYGTNFKYVDIQFVENKWYAWYYHDNTKLMKQKIVALLGSNTERLPDG